MYTKKLLNIENCDKEEREIIEKYGKTGMLYIDILNNYKILVPIGIEDQEYRNIRINIFMYSQNEFWHYIYHFYEKSCYVMKRKETKIKNLYKHYQKDILMIIKALYGL